MFVPVILIITVTAHAIIMMAHNPDRAKDPVTGKDWGVPPEKDLAGARDLETGVETE